MEDRRPPLTRSLVLVIVIGAILLTSLKIISYGFMPSDDALRHAAKAVTQKSWPEIVVMRPLVFDDQHAGWHSFLGAVYQATGCTKEDLVVLSVVLLATLFLVAPIPWLRRPEIWPLVWVYVAIAADPFVVGRIFLGRPFIFTMAVVLTLCLVWPRLKSERLPVGTLVLLLVAVALCTWFHGMPHLFLIPLLAFALAREWLAALRLAVVLVLGILLGASLTGHPILLIWEAWLHSQRAFLDSPLQHMLVTEFQSYAGEGTLPLAILLVLLWRWARGEWDSQKIVRDPVFILMSLGWLLGFTVMRFWTDWGLVAALAWCARELDEVAQRKLPIFSNKRLAVALVGGGFLFVNLTSDIGGRWTRSLTRPRLSQENPNLREMLPEPGGIVYSDVSQVFYNTFFDNPHGQWRYIMGFEPTLMPEDDLKILRGIQWNWYADEAFAPWVAKMRPADRMILFRNGRPGIQGLEWASPIRGIWVGRLPRKPAETEVISQTDDGQQRSSINNQLSGRMRALEPSDR